MAHCSRTESLNHVSLLLMLLTFVLISVILLVITVNGNCVPTKQNVEKDILPEILESTKFEMVTRNEWQAKPPTNNKTTLRTPVPYVIIQQTQTENCFSREKCIFQVRYIQTFHVESRGWNDIGYNCLIGGDGTVYNGRGWDVQGAHTYGYNGNSIGIAFIGTFMLSPPSNNQLEACKKLIHEGVTSGYIRKDYNLFGSRQLRMTDSPGDKLYEEIRTWPHWTDTSSEWKSTKLKMINRLEWLAHPPSHISLLSTPVPYVIIHHTETENCSSQAQCIFQTRFIQTFHMESIGWDDIGYNFLIGGDGIVYNGREWDVQGAHTYRYNGNSIGIAFIGTYMSWFPSENQLEACKKLIHKGVTLGHIQTDYTLFGARQLQHTRSPGDKLYQEIKTWPHWKDKPQS